MLFCTGNKCLGKGGEEMKILAQNIVDNSPELASLLVSKTGCLNMCESGPMVLLYPEGTWFSDMTEGRTRTLLDAIREKKANPLPGNVAYVLGAHETPGEIPPHIKKF
jgi:(2Fe-2S) ferredoxin